MKKILITGSTGFIGKRLAEDLDSKYDLILIVRDKNKVPQDIKKAEVMIGDIRDKKVVSEAVKRANIVIHLASCYESTAKDQKEMLEVNFEATQNLILECCKYKIEHFIYVSTIGVFGRITTEVNEESKCNPRKYDLYEQTKFMAEEMIKEIAQKEAIPFTILRPSTVYGPQDLRLLKLFQMIKKEKFFFIGRGDNNICFLYIDDLIEVFNLILEREVSRNQIFIVASSKPTKLYDFVNYVAEYLGVKKPKLHLPIWPLWIMAIIFEKIGQILKIVPPIYRARINFFLDNQLFDLSKVYNLLDFKPKVSIEEGIKRTIEWYVKKSLI